MQLSLPPLSAQRQFIDERCDEIFKHFERSIGGECSSSLRTYFFAIEAEVVNLPLTRAAFSDIGGALEFSIRSASQAFVSAKSSIFSGHLSGVARDDAQSAYELAATCASAVSGLQFLPRELAICINGEPWCELPNSLRDAARAAGVDAFDALWLPPTGRPIQRTHAAFMFARCWGKSGMTLKNHSAWRDMVAAIMPPANPEAGEGMLTQVIRSSIAKVLREWQTATSRELVRSPVQLGEPTENPKKSVNNPDISQCGAGALGGTNQAQSTSVPTSGPNGKLPTGIEASRTQTRAPATQSSPEFLPAVPTIKSESPVGEHTPSKLPLLHPLSERSTLLFRAMREHVMKDENNIKKQLRTEADGSVVLARRAIATYGMPDSMIIDDLRAAGLLVATTPTGVTLNKRIADFLVDGVVTAPV